MSQLMLEKQARCNLCGAEDFHVKFYKAPYTRVQCNHCGLVWSAEQPDNTQLVEMYDASYFQGDTYLDYLSDQSIIEINARKRLQQIHHYKRPPGVMLEVGCATGFFLNVCRAHGWTTRGLELSEYASAYARNKLKLDVRTGVLENDTFEKGSADVITLWDVIEHVPDPMQTFQNAAACLKSDGLLVLSTGDIQSFFSRLLGSRWRLITYDHLYYFSPDTIRAYLDRVGLQIIQISYPGRLVSPRLVAHMMGKHYLRLNIMRNLLIGVARWLPNLPLDFMDVMTVYARKVTP